MTASTPARLRPVSIALLLATALLAAPQAEGAVPRIVVVPLGDPSEKLIDMTVHALRDRFNFEVVVAPKMDLPEDAWYAPRKRWRAEKILRALDDLSFGEAPVWRVAAITDAPISTTKGDIEDWGIAGLGSLDGKSSVFSAYLYRGLIKKPAQYEHAIDNLVLHEVGHTLGLPHCPLDRCIMADAKGNALKSAALSINEFCPRCFEAVRRHLRADAVGGTWTDAERAELRRLSKLATPRT